MKEDLSKKIVSFIENYYLINGYSPTIREICEKTGIKSTSTIHSYLNKLASMGILEKTTQKSRAITIKKAELSFRPVPIIGRVTAGEPIFAEENLEGYFPLPEELNLGDEMFILQVKGESMINAGIFDKDKIVVIGAGNVGEAIAYTLMVRVLANDIVLVDLNEDRAKIGWEGINQTLRIPMDYYEKSMMDASVNTLKEFAKELDLL